MLSPCMTYSNFGFYAINRYIQVKCFERLIIPDILFAVSSMSLNRLFVTLIISIWIVSIFHPKFYCDLFACLKFKHKHWFEKNRIRTVSIMLRYLRVVIFVCLSDVLIACTLWSNHLNIFSLVTYIVDDSCACSERRQLPGYFKWIFQTIEKDSADEKKIGESPSSFEIFLSFLIILVWFELSLLDNIFNFGS